MHAQTRDVCDWPKSVFTYIILVQSTSTLCKPLKCHGQLAKKSPMIVVDCYIP